MINAQTLHVKFICNSRKTLNILIGKEILNIPLRVQFPL